ncbi:hypothetical protein BASA60_004046 [Batrachochytrium salamandrivorans]|nr:hypothetical protein BASA60_004046 [Batrachochytrium salamandrivorans]
MPHHSMRKLLLILLSCIALTVTAVVIPLDNTDIAVGIYSRDLSQPLSVLERRSGFRDFWEKTKSVFSRKSSKEYDLGQMNEAKRAKVNSFLALVSELGDRMIKWSDKNKQNPDSWENITGDKLEDLQKVYKKRVFSFLTRGASVKKVSYKATKKISKRADKAGDAITDVMKLVEIIDQKVSKYLKEVAAAYFPNSPDMDPKLKDMAEFVDTIHADVQKIREQLKELIEFANSPQAPEPAPESTSAPAQTGTLVELTNYSQSPAQAVAPVELTNYAQTPAPAPASAPAQAAVAPTEPTNYTQTPESASNSTPPSSFCCSPSR